MIDIVKELDNIQLKNLSILLNKNTVLKRFYPLIPICHSITNQLLQLGISDKYMYLKQMESSSIKLSAEANIDINLLILLQSFLHLYDFKERRLAEIENINENLILSLKNNNIKTSGDYLLFCISHKKSDIVKMFTANEADIVKLFNLCDLMRLPGVKSVRANLFYDCNYKSLQDFSIDTPNHMQAQINSYIIKNSIQKSTPFIKELSTQIAVSKSLPHISF